MARKTVSEAQNDGDNCLWTQKFDLVGLYLSYVDCSSPSRHKQFIVFTDHRYLKVSKLNDSLYGVSYYKSGSNWDKLLGKKVQDRRWMDPHRAYKESYLPKIKLPDYSDFEYSTIKGVIRNDYFAQYKSEQISLVELRLDFYNRFIDVYKTFKAKDGAFIYDLLNLAIQNGGKVSTQSTKKETASDDSDIIHLINSLADLHKAGLLTDNEFEQKKQELLNRL